NIIVDVFKAMFFRRLIGMRYWDTLKVPKQFVMSHKLHGYSSAIVSHCHKKFVFKLRKRAVSEMFSTPTLRCMKDRSGLWAEQWVWFCLSEDITLKD
nr:hypothetical protein [Tanacetum cinerariifolium]